MRNGYYQHFKYDSAGLLIAKTNPTSTSSWPSAFMADPTTLYSYTYYSSADVPQWTGRLKTETMPANISGYRASETYEYDRAFTTGGVTNPTGAPVAGRGLITKKTHADTYYQSFGYNTYGYKMWEDNELRKRTTYVYDGYGRIVSITPPFPITHSETFSYLKPGTSPSYLHTTDSVYTHTSPAGVITTNIYDNNWRKTSTTSGTGAQAATTWFHYDANGNRDYVTDGRGTQSGDASYTTYSDYDNRNRVWQIRQPLGHTTVFHFDEVGNVRSIDKPDGTTESKTYDALNRVLTHTVPKENPANNNQVEDSVTCFFYNPSGTVHSVTNANGQMTTFDYNASDEKTKMTYPGGSFQQWGYDNAHNLKNRTTVGTTSVPGNVQSFGFDNRNQKHTMVWDNQAEWAYFIHDPVGRLTQTYNGTGAWNTNRIATVTRQYDDAGRMMYDRQEITGLATHEVDYEYDDDGHQSRLHITPTTYDYTFTYDTLGRFENIGPTNNPNSIQYHYIYDKASNEWWRRNLFSHMDQIYTRDSLNRMSRLDIRQTSSNVIGYESYGYDGMNRVTTITREDNKRDVFTYYKDGELWTASYGVTGIQAPDIGPPPDEPPADDPGDPPPTSGSNDPPPEQYDLPPPDAPPKENPDPGWLDSQPPSEKDSVNAPVEGDPVPVGEAITIEESHVADDGEAPDSARNVTYKLDKMGNRTSVIDGATTIYTPNALNQYTAVGGHTLTNGRYHEMDAYDGLSVTYINDERLSGATYLNYNYQLAYDSLGRCVTRTRDGVATYYIYDGENPIAEFTSTSAWAGWNLYGGRIDEIIQRNTYGYDNLWHYCFCQQDRNGNVTHLTNAGVPILSAIEKYRYDAFGTPTVFDANGTHITATLYNNRFLFTGREYAATFKFYEYRARAYNPALGRFMSEDPKGFAAGDYNLFRYCDNDPWDLVDPMGLDPVVVSLEANNLALEADVRNFTAMEANKFLGIWRFEYGTTVYRDSQKSLSLSETRTDHSHYHVLPPFDPTKTSVVETHSHTFDAVDWITHSTLSRDDVMRGYQKGRTEEVISPNGTRDRFRPPTDKPTPPGQEEGGIIERYNSATGKWAPLRGANTNLNDPTNPRNGMLHAPNANQEAQMTRQEMILRLRSF